MERKAGDLDVIPAAFLLQVLPIYIGLINGEVGQEENIEVCVCQYSLVGHALCKAVSAKQ